ncbi:phytanoyl-CoA dioxygenase family protein [Actinophytocola sp.]|uniref:phytanoyl-CoA dioxygenase family protein n=1 Tax=Actinophytocola sp. TaxID=1872138 RepID=UPI002D3729AC|nr:phytanoyl-CoA dioxygenase family protein [Actinophytocola sp.]HYQ69799.1 phytanoyl-CoA dioxygenase family protein [Actinophytocola sp.]
MSVLAPEAPLRDLSAEEVDAFHRDGAIRISGVFPSEWVTRLSEGVDFVLDNPSILARATASHASGRGTGDAFMWKTHQTFHDFVFTSPAARIAQQLLRSRTVNAFYDQIFAKPKATGQPTPFHEDASSFPIEGGQVVAIWIALDPCGPESAALKVVRGSHEWDTAGAPMTSSLMHSMMKGGKGTAAEAPAPAPARHDVVEWDEKDLLAWDLVPGDAVAFNPAALHGATGTGPERDRRAFCSRWLGDGVTFQPDRGVLPMLWDPAIEPGDPMGGPLFPRVLPTIDEAVREWRPQEPDQERVDRFVQAIRRV